MTTTREYNCPGCGKLLKSLQGIGTHVQYGDGTCTPEARFWGKVRKAEGEDACWLWEGATTTHGYGCLQFEGRVLGAHKVAYMLSKGEVQDGMKIRHSCDTRLCCRPKHLWLGTHADNMADMAARGRGQKHGKRILTTADVIDIRSQRGKKSSGELSKQYNVQQSYIFAIWRGSVWKKVA